MYLTKLRALSTKNQLTDGLTKLTKPGSVGFVSERSRRFSENACPEVNDETVPIISENATLANRQNGQNLPGYGDLGSLRANCPDLIDVGRWRRAIADGQLFLDTWGAQAAALGWASDDLFGLFPVPVHAHPSFQRLARYDETGLIWLLRGRAVVGLTASTAAIQNFSGSITCYRRHNKPAIGPLGDTLDDFQ
jgi:hypothetical protein